MAEITVMTDDLEAAAGKHVASTEENPVTRLLWAYDGTRYQIDLTAKNRSLFDKAVERFLAASQEYIPHVAEPARASRVAIRRSAGTKKSGNPNAEIVRAWAASKKIHVSDRGRIPEEIWQRWERETGNTYNSGSSQSQPAASNGSPVAQPAETADKS
jgi:Lsr2